MEYQYRIEGMSCQACVEKVSHILNEASDIDHARVQLQFPQAVITAARKPDLDALNARLGDYRIVHPGSEAVDGKNAHEGLSAYKPLFLIVLFLLMVTILAQAPFSHFSIPLAMRHFMAGFFIVFSFFKLLDLRAFAHSFAMYDILASRWKLYGYVYPFIELALGLAYFTNSGMDYMHYAVIVVLGLGTVGVVQSVVDKRKIQCACLGTVFNLPMSRVTIIENVSMIAMAAYMILA